MVKIYSQSVNRYIDWYNLPIIKAIEEIKKGGFYEEKNYEQESFKQTLFKNSTTN